MPLTRSSLGAAGRAASLGVLRPASRKVWRYLWGRFRFPVARNAPGGRYFEGTLAEGLTITDTTNELAVSGGAIRNTNAASVTSTKGLATGGLARVAGRSLAGTMVVDSVSGNYPFFGWNTSNILSGFSVASPAGAVINNGVLAITGEGLQLPATVGFSGIVGGETVRVWMVLRGAGAFILTSRNGGPPTLLWPVIANNTATLYAVSRFSTSLNGLDDLSVGDLPAPWNSDYGIATARVASTAGFVSQARTADALVEFTINVPATGEEAAIVKFQDNNNRWRISLQPSAITLTEINNGVQTTRGTFSHGLAAGASARVVVINDGGSWKGYINNVQAWAYTDPGAFLAANLVANWNGGQGGTVTNFICWPRTITIPAPAAYLVGPFTFDTPKAAPLAEYVETGAAGRMAATDTTAQIGMAGGEIVWAGGRVSAQDPVVVSVASWARAAGRAMLGRLRLTASVASAYVAVGWSSVAGGHTNAAKIAPHPSGIFVFDNGTAITLPALAGGQVLIQFEVAIILRSAGALYFLKGGPYATWTLIWVGTMSLGAVWASANHPNAGIPATLDDLRVVDLPGKWASDYGIALARSTFTAADGAALPAPDSGPAWAVIRGTLAVLTNRARATALTTGLALAVVDAGAADVIVEATIRLELANADTLSGLFIRGVDNANGWIISLVPGAPGAIRLMEFTAGVATTRASASLAINTAQDYRLVVIAHGQSVSVYLDTTAGPTYALATAFQAATLHGMAFGNTDSIRVDNFIVWPRSVALPAGV